MHQEIIVVSIIIIIIVIIGFTQKKQIEDLVNNYYYSPKTNDTCLDIDKGGISRIDLSKLSCLTSDKYETIPMIAKNGSFIPETIAESTIYYHMPHKWNTRNSWLFKDLVLNKYYIPEGLLRIEKGTKFLQLGLESDHDINYYIIKEIKK